MRAIPFIETDLVKFIVLVIPGILGMWVYKPFVDCGDDKEHYNHDILTALLIGAVGYIAASILSAVRGGFFSTVWGASLASALSCIVVGAVFGCLNRHCSPLTFALANLDSRFTRHPSQVGEPTGISNFVKETKRKLKKQQKGKKLNDQYKDMNDLYVVAKVYKLGNANECEIGAVFFQSTNNDEIELYPIEGIDSNYLKDKVNGGNVLSYTKFVNLNSGIVTEVGLVKASDDNEIKDAR